MSSTTHLPSQGKDSPHPIYLTMRSACPQEEGNVSKNGKMGGNSKFSHIRPSYREHEPPLYEKIVKRVPNSQLVSPKTISLTSEDSESTLPTFLSRMQFRVTISIMIVLIIAG